MRLFFSSYPFDPLKSKNLCLCKEIYPNRLEFDLDVPIPRQGLKHVLHGNKVIQFGGYGGFDDDLDDSNESFLFDPNQRILHPLQTFGEIPSPRAGHSLNIYNNFIVLFGGYSGISLHLPINTDAKRVGEYRTNDLYFCDLQTFEWKLIEANGTKPTPRSHHASIIWRNYLYIHSGWVHELNKSDGKLFRINLEELIWEEVKTKGYSPNRSHHTTVVKNDYMLLFGGFYNNARFNSLHALDLLTNYWKEISTIGRIPKMSEHTSILMHNSMFVYGGYNGNEAFNTLFEHNFDDLRWKKYTIIGDAPPKRYLHSSIGHLDSIYVFSGYDTMNLSNAIHELYFGPFRRCIEIFVKNISKCTKFGNVTIEFQK